MSITLPSNLVWVTDELGVAVVPGDHFPAIPNFRQELPSVAPQEWAQWDKPCETCWGHRSDDLTPPATCPDCRNGRQVWEVRWPCDDEGCSWGADCEGFLSARATLQVVPVVEGDAVPVPPIRPDGVYVSQRLGKAWLDSEYEHDLPLDPLPTPGRDYVLVVRKVTPQLLSEHQPRKDPA